MMSRGISWPVCVWRKPVSIGCPASVRISITSPFFALAGTLTTTRAIRKVSSRVFSYEPVLEAGRQRHHHRDLVGPAGAVRHLRDGDDAPRIGDACARGERGAARARAELRVHDVGLRILLG